MNHSLGLTGLDGGNPLAFLAALGTFRTLTLAWPYADVRLSWHLHSTWHPMLSAARLLQQESLGEALHAQLQRMKGHPALAFGDNLGVAPVIFR
jgi:hypothetical protein